MTYKVFGIRHHGPGSARSLCAALEQMQPDMILIEGPPEADTLVPFSTHPDMQPPVAILVYAPDDPNQAVYYPFARFSPEWQAMRFGNNKQVPVKFMDLPVSMRLALEKELEQAVIDEDDDSCDEDEFSESNRSGNSDENDDGNENCDRNETSEPAFSGKSHQSQGPDQNTQITPDAEAQTGESIKDTESLEQRLEHDQELLQRARLDPLSLLADVAGYDDSERWWEHLVEERRSSLQGMPAEQGTSAEVFQGIAEAMTALRQEVDKTASANPDWQARLETLREAHMRKTIRAAEKDGFKNIAVICGAWHVPALQTMPAKKVDTDLLKGLPKMKTAATWVPWSYGRLSFASGYGAGINSPGWYDHLWQQQDKISLHWLTKVAHTFRNEGLDVSSAHVIETVRLADALCAMRGRPLPGLSELNDATQSVMLFGDTLPMRLLREKLIISERLGRVPEDTPMTPLQKDLLQQQKRLRLPASASDKELVLDLRKPNDLQRSYLLRQLRLLNVDWGKGGTEAGGKGTFKEAWRILWKPEFEIKLIEAGRWGNTIKSAANAATVSAATQSNSLEQLAILAQDALFADLESAVQVLMHRMQEEAALSADILHLMAALPNLAHLLRYGDVRKTSLDSVVTVVNGLVTRVCIGLPNACSSLNEDAAEYMYNHVQGVQDAVTLLENSEYTQQWQTALEKLLEQAGLHPLLAGRCCRLLLQAGAIDEAEAARHFGLALSQANEPADAAYWADGFLRGSGQLLIYDESLWNILDQWICELPGEAFTNMLPVLRRTFSTFEPPERRQMAERVKSNKAALPMAASSGDFDADRAKLVIPVMSTYLGLDHKAEESSNE